MARSVFALFHSLLETSSQPLTQELKDMLCYFGELRNGLQFKTKLKTALIKVIALLACGVFDDIEAVRRDTTCQQKTHLVKS